MTYTVIYYTLVQLSNDIMIGLDKNNTVIELEVTQTYNLVRILTPPNTAVPDIPPFVSYELGSFFLSMVC